MVFHIFKIVQMVPKHTTHHKCFKTNDSEICSPDFDKSFLEINYPYPDGQSCSVVSSENEGYTQSRAFKNQ